ncbi:MAG: phosphoribosylanthranilate isomerase [Chitinophagales bacterium]|nr:phosphoribosylanthranilate isomerase [Chitinophagales bacterium]
MKVKICGMREAANIEAVVKLQPDFMGFIFYPKSKRYITEIPVTIPSNIKKVGVFVNEDIKNIIKIATQNNLDYIQLHGDEAPEYCEELKLFDIKIIKAFGIDDNFDFTVIDDYLPFIDFVLFDNKSQQYGGTGEKFSWYKLKEYNGIKPYFLSGGLDQIDIPYIEELLGNTNIYALDFNSKLEIEPALKDIEKCKTVIELTHKM